MPARSRLRDRLDRILVERGLVESRAKAQALIMAGKVSTGGVRLNKPGLLLAPDAPLELTPGRRWVSRGGDKLAPALERFAIPVEGRDALDVGASTGGFTHVLLERGARRIVALDVGRGQLDWSLRNDRRVHPLEGVNARHLGPETLPFPPSLAVIDVSFISLRLVLPPVVGCLSPEGDVVALVKPQFEVGRSQVGRGGIVRDPARHREVVQRLMDFSLRQGWGVQGVCASALRGADGNREFFLHLTPVAAGPPRRELEARLEAELPGSGGEDR